MKTNGISQIVISLCVNFANHQWAECNPITYQSLVISCKTKQNDSCVKEKVDKITSTITIKICAFFITFEIKYLNFSPELNLSYVNEDIWGKKWRNFINKLRGYNIGSLCFIHLGFHSNGITRYFQSRVGETGKGV